MTAPLPTVRLNGRELPCPPGTTLHSLLEREGLRPERVATALNARFVPRAARADTPLQAGDEVSTFEAIVGG
ncbi:sulfur carrier protein ThiS [Hydrogenophaga sp. YM1]|jgi:sulfur carrier protein|uniref:sulfur carrier protein ThiS n=1 Tax=Hydrogenophaga TaxID=47420 RepID=UPI0008684925|nr:MULTISPECIES: sulfur carrier protein ThiS [unclassified Hydrogenophaga]MBN9370539.1 sulfur carrier protein ThiS [Hydrogenophaga sp.]ODT32202.1 MAG: thiamine biosynthesis protein ThiS [Hydrogenophaga sp. SCN 70-13]OJV56760.1 MAG: thiamine biosynthesis protein ThiS [Hydrogenophaga sp. 70-12]QRR35380.1 sulfur carrier protein ThiS [Hydrogenophaga sp. YM1]